MNTEKQEQLRQFVSREVIYCVSHLISELMAKAEHHPDYTDDLYDFAYRQPTEEEIAEGDENGTDIYEHWIVTDWLADKLIETGENVKKDFFGLTVWGRCTTGQAIYCDGVIEEIFDDLQK
jgi:hypothetical protein